MKLPIELTTPAAAGPVGHGSWSTQQSASPEPDYGEIRVFPINSFYGLGRDAHFTLFVLYIAAKIREPAPNPKQIQEITDNIGNQAESC